MKNEEKSSAKNEEERISLNCSDEELEEWIATSVKVLTVLKDENQEISGKIYADFILDLQNLKKADRITDEIYDDILENV